MTAKEYYPLQFAGWTPKADLTFDDDFNNSDEALTNETTAYDLSAARGVGCFLQRVAAVDSVINRNLKRKKV